MQVYTNIPLKNYLTMKIGGNARFMTEVHTPQELAEVYKNSKKQNLPVFVLGGGSNVIATDKGFDGLVIRIKIPGFEVISEDSSFATVKIGASENWDTIVEKAVQMNLSGIEAMSAIPGTAGAAPVQNTGAYGQEIADTLVFLEAYDSKADSFVTLVNEECGFSYRNSIFRDKEYGRYVITSITLKLSKSLPQPPFYDSLQRYLDEHNIKIYTQEIIRNTVIAIRKEKLPDPKIMPNAGSFFKNGLVEKWQLENLKNINPDMPTYDMGDGTYKVPSGWLIEQVGLKGQALHGMKVYDKNALVLVNESAKSYDDLALARDEIIGKVRDTFHIQIEQEPLQI